MLRVLLLALALNYRTLRRVTLTAHKLNHARFAGQAAPGRCVWRMPAATTGFSAKSLAAKTAGKQPAELASLGLLSSLSARRTSRNAPVHRVLLLALLDIASHQQVAGFEAGDPAVNRNLVARLQIQLRKTTSGTEIDPRDLAVLAGQGSQQVRSAHFLPLPALLFRQGGMPYIVPP